MSTKEKTIAILGGGQLSRMLIEAGKRLELSPAIFCLKKDEPAALLASKVVCGDLMKPEGQVVLASLLKKIDLVLFENEFIPCELLEKLSPSPETQFSPPLRTMRTLQNKISQKRLLEDLGIPTSPYKIWERDQETAAGWIETLIRERPLEAWVLKWATNGYDGKGVYMPQTKDRLKAEDFCLSAAAAGIPVFAERKILFSEELAMIGCRSTTGEFKTYPLVVSKQASGICRYVIGPVSQMISGFHPETNFSQKGARLESEAIDYTQKIAEASGLTGSFGVEFFLEAETAKLWVNEIAPRVHNSGHYSQDACAVSQFENHWRACLGLPLGETKALGSFAMLNLLGTIELEVDSLSEYLNENSDAPIQFGPKLENIFFHWYYKKGLKVGRKLGHINVISKEGLFPNQLLPLLETAEKKWQGDLLRAANAE